MSEEDAFLDGIATDRADRTRLLVFADWLADRSDPREEFVRLHTRLLEMDGTEPEFEERDNAWNRWVREGTRSRIIRPSLGNRWLDAICRAFTASDVAAHLASNPDDVPIGVDREDFPPSEHINPNGTEALVLYHGAADRFEGALDFAARTVLLDLWDDPFRATAPDTEPLGSRFLTPVTRGGFWQRWRGHCACLRNPPALPVIVADNSFFGAQYIEGDLSNCAFVAAHRNDYFALLWRTTA